MLFFASCLGRTKKSQHVDERSRILNQEQCVNKKVHGLVMTLSNQKTAQHLKIQQFFDTICNDPNNTQIYQRLAEHYPQMIVEAYNQLDANHTELKAYLALLILLSPQQSVRNLEAIKVSLIAFSELAHDDAIYNKNLQTILDCFKTGNFGYTYLCGLLNQISRIKVKDRHLFVHSAPTLTDLAIEVEALLNTITTALQYNLKPSPKNAAA